MGDDRPAARTVGAKPVQNGGRKANGLGKFRVCVKRVAVSREPIEQRLVLCCGCIEAAVRRPGGYGMRNRGALGWTAKAPVAARKCGGEHGAERLPACLVTDTGFAGDQRALVGPLVGQAGNAGLGADRAFDRYRSVQVQSDLSMA